jgi:hypothetical protein
MARPAFVVVSDDMDVMHFYLTPTEIVGLHPDKLPPKDCFSAAEVAMAFAEPMRVLGAEAILDGPPALAAAVGLAMAFASPPKRRAMMPFGGVLRPASFLQMAMLDVFLIVNGDDWHRLLGRSATA